MLEIADRLETTPHKPTCSPKLQANNDLAEDDELIDVGETEELKFKKILISSQKIKRETEKEESNNLVPKLERSHSFSIAELIRK